MIRLESIKASEKLYPYVDVECGKDCKNGTVGYLDGAGDEAIFYPVNKGQYVVMQVEKGDDMHTAEFIVKEGERVRVLDMFKAVGEVVNITADNIVDGMDAVKNFGEGTKLISNADGDLEENDAPDDIHFVVKEKTRYGVRAVIEE